MGDDVVLAMACAALAAEHVPMGTLGCAQITMNRAK